MILAAGYGTRLWPLTIDRTKPAIPFMGKPLVGYVAEYLAANGIGEVLVNLHHRPDSVRSALGDGSRFGVKLSYIEEKEILGTSGAWDNAKEWLDGGTFLVINGKIVTDIDLRAALKAHKESQALATLVLLPNPARERFSRVLVSEGLVQGFGSHPSASDNDADGPFMFTGIQILEPEIFRYIPRGRFSHSTTDVYPQAIAAGEKILAYVAAGNWRELSTIERYLETTVELLQREGRRAVFGEGAQVAENAEVTDSIGWENVTIGAGAKVTDSILGAGVRILPGEIWDKVAIVRKELALSEPRPEKGREGRIVGDNFVVSLG
jgi:NDP-sugar pyrophosphorylase family protein